MSTITGQQLQAIGEEMLGTKWKKQIGSLLGLSDARVYQLAALTTVPAKSSEKIMFLYKQWKESGAVEKWKPTVGILQLGVSIKDEDENFTDDEIITRTRKRFATMSRMVDGMLKGVIRSMIISGAPGIGKTFDLEEKIKKAHRETGLEYTILRGTCSAPGLYQALYGVKDGGIVVIDDSDTIFTDEQAFNIMKAALDSTNKRTIAWRKQAAWIYDPVKQKDTDNESKFPNEFDFEGAVVFITNKNFRREVDKETRLSPHFGALLSRSMYLDLTLHSMRSRILRIKDVFRTSMRQSLGLTKPQGEEILEYVLDNADRINEMSLRTVKHISDLYQLGSDWKDLCEVTKMKFPKSEE
jgi:hypothetical protein